MSRRRLMIAVVPWIVVVAGTALVFRCFVGDPLELTHVLRYAVVGAVVALLTGVLMKRDTRPQLAFACAAGLAACDELVRAYLLDGARLDFARPLLALLGATWGILPFVTIQRVRGGPLPAPTRTYRRTVVGAACVLLPLLLFSPITAGVLFGDTPRGWSEVNGKPMLWLGSELGVPLLLIALLVLGQLLQPRPRGLSQSALALVLVLMVVAVQPPSRLKGTAVHEPVPTARANKAHQPIVIDGVLEPVWERAPRLGPFVHNASGEPVEHTTWARVLWDDEAIYFAFEVEDADVWARDTHRDDPFLPSDEVVEVFLDDGGDEVTYFELEVSPKNVVQDLFVSFPKAPVEHDPGLPFRAMNGWNAPGLRTAVQVDGTLDVRALGDPGQVVDVDRGYVVEIALPWRDIQPFPALDPDVAHRRVPPAPGDRWRLGLYRTEQPRPAGLSRQEAQGAMEFQAWARTREISFHVPRFFGVLEFAE